MAFYIRTKSIKKAKEILERVLKDYSGDVVSYNLEEEEYDLSNLPEDIIMEIRRLGKRGGSLSFNFPAFATKYLGFREGDHLGVILNRKSGRIYMVKIEKIKVSSRINIR